MPKQKQGLNKLRKLSLPRIKVIGVGGGGSSIVAEIAKIFSKKKVKNAKKIDFVAANVDWQALKVLPKRVKKFYFGEEITCGLGCGMNPELGEKAARADKAKIQKELKKADFCIFVSCLGGGTGSGAMPVFAQIASSLNLLTLGVFTLPFKFEGQKRMEIARASVAKIRPNLNSTVIISNQKIFQLVKEQTPLCRSFLLMNKILAQTFEGLIEALYQPGMINTDFADLKSILKQRGGLAFLGSFSASGKNRVSIALKKLFQNPLTNFDLKEAQAFLCDIAGSKNLSMQEIEKVASTIYQFSPKAKIILGINSPRILKDKVRITLLAICYPQEKKQKKAEKKKEVLKEEKKKKIKKMAKKKKRPPSFKIKRRVRRDALDLHKIAKKAEEDLFSEEKKWDIPTFLRRKLSSSK
ncbi:MAG: cell division FtsZ family protein [Candidatus Pacebacteria bacterium]|nr:cell division FtsZ family protein [Candidatus Paceibacterota bacterium]